MKIKMFFMLAVFALLVLTACSSQDTTQPTASTAAPGQEPAEEIDTSELDALEQDLSTIEQNY